MNSIKHFIEFITALILIIIFTSSSNCQDAGLANRKVIKIWPGLAPGTENRLNEEKIIKGNIYDVYQPTLTIFLPKVSNKKLPAVVVMPGGGYKDIVINKEGYKIAEWLNKNGIAAFVLKYRLKPSEALQDAQRTMSLLRTDAKKYNINPDNLGVIGFSAGGHLAANLCTHYIKTEMEDHTDSISCKPDFMISVYGAVGPFIDDVNSNTPPAFLALANNDPKVPATESVNYYLALHKYNVPAELHVYEKGGHGFALRDVDKPVISWANRCIDWMKVQGILEK